MRPLKYPIGTVLRPVRHNDLYSELIIVGHDNGYTVFAVAHDFMEIYTRIVVRVLDRFVFVK